MSTIFNIDEWHKLTKEGANVAATIHPSGVSMRPLIRGGLDTVIVMPLRRAPKKGDIVLFRRADGKDVMHRIWKIGGATAPAGTDTAGNNSAPAGTDTVDNNSAPASVDTVDFAQMQPGATITTFGDGCWYPDQPITEDKILGLAVTLYRVKHAKANPASAAPTNSNLANPAGTESSTGQPASAPASGNPASASTRPASRKIKLDTPYRRAIGRAWLFISPLRRCYYRLRNAAHWVKRQIKKRF